MTYFKYLKIHRKFNNHRKKLVPYSGYTIFCWISCSSRKKYLWVQILYSSFVKSEKNFQINNFLGHIAPVVPEIVTFEKRDGRAGSSRFVNQVFYCVCKYNSLRITGLVRVWDTDIFKSSFHTWTLFLRYKRFRSFNKTKENRIRSRILLF